jgi:DNA-binding NarL/FixJ family response regulator
MREGALVPISIVVAQETALAAQLLCRALKERRRYFVVVAGVHTAKELLKQVAELFPDVTVISAALQGDPEGGLKAVRELHVSGSATRAIMLMDCSDSERVVAAFSAGARGVVCRTEPFEVLCRCIRAVKAGQIWANAEELQWIVEALKEREPVHVVSAKGNPLLTPREAQVVSLVMEGVPNREIAVKLGVSAHTVKNHLCHIYEKLGISNRVELILYATSSRERSRGSSITTREAAHC